MQLLVTITHQPCCSDAILKCVKVYVMRILFVLVALAGIVITRKRQSAEIDDAQLAKADAILALDE